MKAFAQKPLAGLRKGPRGGAGPSGIDKIQKRRSVAPAEANSCMIFFVMFDLMYGVIHPSSLPGGDFKVLCNATQNSILKTN